MSGWRWASMVPLLLVEAATVLPNRNGAVAAAAFACTALGAAAALGPLVWEGLQRLRVLLLACAIVLAALPGDGAFIGFAWPLQAALDAALVALAIWLGSQEPSDGPRAARPMQWLLLGTVTVGWAALSFLLQSVLPMPLAATHELALAATSVSALAVAMVCVATGLAREAFRRTAAKEAEP